MDKSVHTPEYRVLRAALREVRAAAGLSQRDLAGRLVVPHSWVAKVETGERRIDAVEFCRFVLACGADPQQIFDRIANAVENSTATRRSRKGLPA
ncbi:MAG: helix-turn-helix domain-containing protein [Pirellulaceae bacterium]|nr:helix-turn-helix domain-containing protein [Pirellulaceae bacterium]